MRNADAMPADSTHRVQLLAIGILCLIDVVGLVASMPIGACFGVVGLEAPIWTLAVHLCNGEHPTSHPRCSERRFDGDPTRA